MPQADAKTDARVVSLSDTLILLTAPRKCNMLNGHPLINILNDFHILPLPLGGVHPVTDPKRSQ